ncbi:rhodanese-like domain-containing protein [Streptomyces fragilis]|uniref:Rhodanese-like domain-containing protein n=1 Tax=Streptomyces fragilis TaxID=67301 RepID=A0ABV2YMT4_9ACTN|nr:rhodanese-like domain-containing protein [Streptomyces fragilis]
MSTFTTLTTAEAAARADDFTIIDVRTPGEYAGGHLPGAHNVPLDRVREAADTLRAAADRGPLLVVCASGARSANGCAQLASLGIRAATLEGGTAAWQAAGHPLERPAGARSVWPMDRQVRLVAGSLVLLGFLVGLAWPPAHWLSGAISAGLVFSGVSNTCGMAAVLGRLPYNRGAAGCPTFDETRRRLAA